MTETARRRLIIRTPEGVEFSLALAGPMTRFLAWAIDFCAVGLASSMIGKLLTLLALISVDLAMATSTLSYFVLSIGYGIALEWLWRGQTLGKRVLGLRVMDARGLKLHVSQIVIRNVLRAIDTLPIFYMVGGIACAVNRYSQRLGDIAANTVVMSAPEAADGDPGRRRSGRRALQLDAGVPPPHRAPAPHRAKYPRQSRSLSKPYSAATPSTPCRGCRSSTNSPATSRPWSNSLKKRLSR